MLGLLGFFVYLFENLVLEVNIEAGPDDDCDGSLIPPSVHLYEKQLATQCDGLEQHHDLE